FAASLYTHTASTDICTLSLHDALPILLVGISLVVHSILQQGPSITITFKTGSGLTANKTDVKYRNVVIGQVTDVELSDDQKSVKDRKSTRLNSSHVKISYAVFCLKKKK